MAADDRSRPRAALGRQDVVDLAGRLAALARAGVAPSQAWSVLAAGDGPGAHVAAIVAGMLGAGGSVAEGLRLAAAEVARPRRWRVSATASTASAADALRWLAIAVEVADRAGAGSAAVLDRVADGVLAELARAEERDVALAGPQLTGVVLSLLPLAGIALGALIGVNVVAALLGTGVGRLCLLVGIAFWAVGRWWISRLVAATARAGS